MSHFHLDKPRDHETAVIEYDWTGVRVRLEVSETTNEPVLIVMPGEVDSSPVLKRGIKLVKIGKDYPILVPIRDKPGCYKDIRETAIQPAWRFIGLDHWVSADTLDPDHILVPFSPKVDPTKIAVLPQRRGPQIKRSLS